MSARNKFYRLPLTASVMLLLVPFSIALSASCSQGSDTKPGPLLNAPPIPGRSLELFVVDFAGNPIANAQIHHSGDALIPCAATSPCSTDNQGRKLIDLGSAPPGTEAQRFVFRVESDGLAPSTAVAILGDREHPIQRVMLAPPVLTKEFSIAEGIDATLNDIRVTIPKDAVASAESTAWLVISAHPKAITANPPASAETIQQHAFETLPGPLVGLSEVVGTLTDTKYDQDNETLGGKELQALDLHVVPLEISIKDSKGMKLQLKQGMSAAVEFPGIESVASPDDKLQAMTYDLDNGIWNEAIAASPANNGAWKAELGHLSWWGILGPHTRYCINVTVYKGPAANGVLLKHEHIPVVAEGIDYTGIDIDQNTNGSGVSCVYAKKGSNAYIYAGYPLNPLMPIGMKKPIAVPDSPDPKAILCSKGPCLSVIVEVDPDIDLSNCKNGPSDEACNGKDDDCDGDVDEPENLVPGDCKTKQCVCAPTCGYEEKWDASDNVHPNQACIPIVDCSDPAQMTADEVWNCNNTNCLCSPGETCLASDECISKVCALNVCQAPSCSDKVQNGDETGEDCGPNPPCMKCPVGTACTDNAECASALCVMGMCQ